MKRKLVAFLLAATPLTNAHAEELKGEELHKALAGKTVYVNTPLVRSRSAIPQTVV